MRYQAKCPHCNYEEEYESPITDPEKNLPECPRCLIGDSTPVKMEKIFVATKTHVVFKGPNWAGRGKAGY